MLNYYFLYFSRAHVRYIMPWLQLATVLHRQARLLPSNSRFLSFGSFNKWCQNHLTNLQCLGIIRLAPTNITPNYLPNDSQCKFNTRNFSTSNCIFSVFNFEKECEETLESLSEHFEELLEGMFSNV